KVLLNGHNYLPKGNEPAENLGTERSFLRPKKVKLQLNSRGVQFGATYFFTSAEAFYLKGFSCFGFVPLFPHRQSVTRLFISGYVFFYYINARFLYCKNLFMRI